MPDEINPASFKENTYEAEIKQRKKAYLFLTFAGPSMLFLFF